MSILNAIFQNTAINYEDAFGAVDCTSHLMKKAILDWRLLYFNDMPVEGEDPCQQIPYTIVNKLCKAVFGEYEVAAKDPFVSRTLDRLNDDKKSVMQQALICGECFVKPFPYRNGFAFSVISRSNVLIFGKDIEGNPTDIGTVETQKDERYYYTLLERRTVEPDGRLTVRNMLYRSDLDGALGSRVNLASLPRYEALPDQYTFPEPVGLGLIRVKTPMVNNVDGSSDGVSVYSAAVGLIHNINRNEYQINGEFARGESRIIVSSDLLGKDSRGNPKLQDHLFSAIDEDPGNVPITIFSPALREQSFINRKREYLRNVENIIGLKRGLLSEVEAAERTATEVTSSQGDYNLTIIDFQQMWEKTVGETAVLCGKLGKLYHVEGAVEVDPKTISIGWGNGVLYDEDKVWADYKSMVASGLLRPEIAVGWYFDLPTETPKQLDYIRQRYMPEIEALAGGE